MAANEVIYLYGDCLQEDKHDDSCEFNDSEANRIEIVKNRIAGRKVIVFSKSYCPYCTRVKQLLKSEGIPFTVVELDQHKRYGTMMLWLLHTSLTKCVRSGVEIQDVLRKLTGQRTVPNVFIKGTHVGGASDTMAAYQSGRLAQLLKD